MKASCGRERRIASPHRDRRILVRKGGLEPPWVAPPDPKSGASANSATFAVLERIVASGQDDNRMRKGRARVPAPR